MDLFYIALMIWSSRFTSWLTSLPLSLSFFMISSGFLIRCAGFAPPLVF